MLQIRKLKSKDQDDTVPKMKVDPDLVWNTVCTLDHYTVFQIAVQIGRIMWSIQNMLDGQRWEKPFLAELVSGTAHRKYH
jgi:hypothetical protein